MKSRKLYTIPLGVIAVAAGLIALYYRDSDSFLRQKGAIAILGGIILLGFEIFKALKNRKT